MADSIKFTIGGQIGPSYKASLEMASAMAIEENERTNALIAAQQAKTSIIPRWGEAIVAMKALGNAYNPVFMQQKGFFTNLEKEALLLKQNAYLKKKAGIMGTMGYGMAPGFASLLSTEAGESTSAGMALVAKQNAYLARKAGIMGTMGSGMAPGFAKLLATEATMAKAPIEDFANAVSKAHGNIPGLNLVLRETLVVFREIGRGNWSRVPGSISLIIQGLRQMRAELGIFGAIFTVTGAIIGSVIVAAGLFAWHIHNIAKGAQELADMIDPLNIKFTEHAKALRAASKEHAEFLEWLKKVGDETETLEHKTSRLIKALREQSEAQIELARAQGASKGAIEKMEEAQLREELRLTSLAKLEAGRQIEQAQFNATTAESAYNKNVGQADLRESVNHAADNAGKILDAAMDTLKEAQDPDSARSRMDRALGRPTPSFNENTPMNVKVDGKVVDTSVADAKTHFNVLSQQAAELADRMERLKAAFEDSKSTVQERTKAEQDLAEKQKELEDELGIKTSIGRQIAAAESRSKGGATGPTEWERAGLSSFGGSKSAMDMAARQLQVQQQIAAMMAAYKHTPVPATPYQSNFTMAHKYDRWGNEYGPDDIF